MHYVGPWLPEPLHTPADGPEEGSLLASSLGMAFMLLLERLTPKERAAYLLREIFDLPYEDVAGTLGIQEATCRKLVSRAKAGIDQAKIRHVTRPDRQAELLAAFEAAIGGGTQRLAALLSEEVTLAADGGGKVPAIQEVLRGKEAVLAFVDWARQVWSGYRWLEADLNGGRGIILEHEGRPALSLAFAYDERGLAAGIYIMRNPDKLGGLSAAIAG
ncbi:MAG TPA: sigma factor-like helix-turn-helix DNA-binding protein [Paracoccaceae bacterium]|nr:sigma factor-like helix-turn-helix DNA-binding protein [Paracoccaceae bacterium]